MAEGGTQVNHVYVFTLEELGIERVFAALNTLEDAGIIVSYLVSADRVFITCNLSRLLTLDILKDSYTNGVLAH